MRAKKLIYNTETSPNSNSVRRLHNMAKLLLNVLKLSPVVLAASLFVSNGAFAAEENVTSVDELAQVTSVNQLSDVDSSHWAFQSVKSLVERYACVAGYPDGTFRGNRKMSRYEFAALLNGCLMNVERLIAAGQVGGADIAALNRLREEFTYELATLRGRVDGLDYRVDQLEGRNQFSKTAKLKGKVEFITGGVTGPNDKIGSTAGANDFGDHLTFGYRARLDITSSFTGKDRLRLRLHQRDNQSFGTDRTGTNMSRIDVQGDTGVGNTTVAGTSHSHSGNFVEVEKLNYDFKPSKNIAASIWAVGAGMDDFLDADKAKVQTTRFAKRNPLIHRSNHEDFGAGATIKFNKNANLQLGYTTINATEAGAGNGLGGDFDLGTQLNFKLGGVKLAASYVHSNGAEDNFSHSTGSSNADLFGSNRKASNSYGIQASTKLGKKTKVGAWYGATKVNQIGSANKATLQNWAAFASFKDAFRKGNVLGLTFGVPPKVTSASGTTADTNTSFLVDVTYRHKVTDRLSLQPGVFMITNPEHNKANNTIYGAVLNTTFKF